MMKINRSPVPDWLRDNWEQWGQEYVEKLQQNPRYQFNWKQIQGEKVNHKLLPLLSEMTNHHCSFCDSFPLGKGVIKPTIEHFKPKSRSKFPALAYQWENLFIACSYCQEKGDAFDDRLLKPDEVYYKFEHFFLFNFRTFEIEARKDNAISNSDKQRAEITLKMYKINGSDRPQSRARELTIFNKITPAERNINDFSYRYMFH